MLPGRLYRIFQRYADIHVAFDLAAGPLGDRGAVTRAQVQGGRIHLVGYTQAQRVQMQINRSTVAVAPVPDPSGRAVFALDLPLEVGPITLTLETDAGTSAHSLRGATAWRIRRARIMLALRFVGVLLVLLPQIYAWKWQGDLAAREGVKQRLGLVPQVRALPLAAGLLGATKPPPEPPPMATLVMPVYNAFDMLPEALRRVVAHSGSAWRLVLIEDCSSDTRVRPWLQAWAQEPQQAGRVSLLCNDTNLGFVGSANRGLEAARAWKGDPVVLLNSDVFVPQGWLGRLLAPLRDGAVASVTPMSNDAEIFTVPVICQRGQIAPDAVDRLDAAAARFDPKAALAEAPTGVGFCMAMAPQFLAQVPQFDTIFGRGYGEETDWCQKTRALGGRHLGAGNVFVEHRGGVSFGSAAKQRLLEQNLSEITRRYPSYDNQVQDFIRHDPLATARLALALVWAGAHHAGTVPVYLAHAMGGGAEIYLKERIAQDLAAGGAAVVLRVGQVTRWQIEVHSAGGVTQGLLDDTGAMGALIALLGPRRIVYSCGVGDWDAVTLPDILVQLAGAAEEGNRLEMLVHDYFPLSPSYTLLGAQGRFEGVPLAGGPLADDPAHIAPRAGPPPAPLADWQAAWGRLVTRCAQITVFCETGRDLMVQVYPQAAPVIRVVPHQLPQLPARIVPPNGPVVIGVLGNIGAHKGAAVVQRLAADLARDAQYKRSHVVVIGHLDPDFGLASPSKVHGSYLLRDLGGLVARYGITCWLIPSVWPETFSFTTHEALATGMPVFAFDLGAQGAAVARAVAQGAPGAVLPLPDAGRLDPALILHPHTRLQAAS